MRGFIPFHLLIPGFVVLSLFLVIAIAKKGDIARSLQFPSTLDRVVTNDVTVQNVQLAQVNEQTPSPSPTEQISPSPENLIESKVEAKLVSPTPTPSPTQRAQAASSTTSGGSYTVATFSLGATVVTDNAADDDCRDSCATKSLSQYVSDNGGRAGINGTYFCPPDYSWCAGKVNSSDFPIWNNRKKKWMNADKLFWNGRGMMVFRGGSAQFFPNAAASGAPSDITGGIVNYPSLMAGGNIVLDEGSIGDNLRVTKGTRSGIGFGNGKLFLVVARSANMRDLANIFQSLGATDALNLDGGGSSALFDGGYKAGPGRSLPNAVIIK